MAQFGVSILICVYNGSKEILPTLEALAEQNIPTDLPCELLIIDNASTDSTADIAVAKWNSLTSPIPLRIIQEPKSGKANALAKGYDVAKYELMLVCDDDTWLQPEYIKTVAEIYSHNLEIGLLGGYTKKAFFEAGEKPDWFDKYEQAYACGKRHSRNGFLKPLDYGIWGAGSVLRKKMWEFIRANGFSFYNGIGGVEFRAEDVELSMAVTFTGHCLYFDERLWFTHDLRGGRVTWKNFLNQEALNGKSRAIIYMYKLAYEKASRHVPFILLYIKYLLFLMGSTLLSQIKGRDIPVWNYHYHTIKELALNRKIYKKVSQDCGIWISRIKDTFPLGCATRLK